MQLDIQSGPSAGGTTTTQDAIQTQGVQFPFTAAETETGQDLLTYGATRYYQQATFLSQVNFPLTTPIT